MVRGTLLAHLRSFVQSEVGARGWTALLAALPPADRAVLGELVVVVAWKPVGVWNRALDRFLTDQFGDPHTAMATLARFVAEQDLTTLFKIVLKTRSPEFVLKRTPSLYNRYFSEGRFEAREVGAHHWRASLTVPRGEETGPAELSCNTGICEWLGHALMLSGVSPSVTHPGCRYRGATTCEYDIVW